MEKEYEVTMKKGFSTKKFYVKGGSAADIQREIERKFAYEIEFEGLFLKEIKKV